MTGRCVKYHFQVKSQGHAGPSRFWIDNWSTISSLCIYIAIQKLVCLICTNIHNTLGCGYAGSFVRLVLYSCICYSYAFALPIKYALRTRFDTQQSDHMRNVMYRIYGIYIHFIALILKNTRHGALYQSWWQGTKQFLANDIYSINISGYIAIM